MASAQPGVVWGAAATKPLDTGRPVGAVPRRHIAISECAPADTTAIASPRWPSAPGAPAATSAAIVSGGGVSRWRVNRLWRSGATVAGQMEAPSLCAARALTSWPFERCQRAS